MELGAFSVSLTVKDLEASRSFYERLGFEPVGGDVAERWLIVKNGEHVIGLFEGMFEQNILTFNPGWDQDGRELDAFTDVRDIQGELERQGIALDSTVSGAALGPASITLTDPDGNAILIDQHR